MITRSYMHNIVNMMQAQLDDVPIDFASEGGHDSKCVRSLGQV